MARILKESFHSPCFVITQTLRNVIASCCSASRNRFCLCVRSAHWTFSHHHRHLFHPFDSKRHLLVHRQLQMLTSSSGHLFSLSFKVQIRWTTTPTSSGSDVKAKRICCSSIATNARMAMVLVVVVVVQTQNSHELHVLGFFFLLRFWR